MSKKGGEETMSGKIKGITLQIGSDVTPLQKGIRSLNAEANSLQRELRGVETLLKMSPKSTELLLQKQELLTKAVGETKTKLEVLRDTKAKIDEDMANGTQINEKEYRNLTREIAFTEAELKKLESSLSDTNNVWKGVADNLDKFGNKAVETGGKLTKGITVPIMAIGAASIAAFNEVDNALDTIVTKTGATGEAMAGFEGVFRNIAQTMPLELQDIGDAVGEVNTQFGLTGEALESASRQMLMFADINKQDVTSSSIASKKAMESFGLTVEDLDMVLDSVTNTAQATGVSTDSLFNSVTKGGPQLRAMGLSFSESVAIMGQFEQKGVDSGKALSYLSRSQVEFAKEGLTLQEGLEALGNKMEMATSETEKLTIASEYFGTKGASVMLDAFERGALDVTALGEATEGSMGKVKDTFEGTLDPLDQFKTAMNNVKILGSDFATILQEVLAPVLERMVESLQDAVKWFDELDPKTKEMIVKFGILAAVLGPIVVVVGHLALGLKRLIELKLILTPIIAGLGGVSGIAATGVGALGTAFTFLTGPIGLTIVAITAVVGSITWLYKKFKGTKDDIVDESQDMAREIEEMMEDINNPDSLYDPYFDIGEDINIGLADGINSNGDLALDAVDEQSKELAEKVKENISELDKFGSAISTALTNQYKEMQAEQIEVLDNKVENEKKASGKIIENIKETLEHEKSILNERLSYLKSSTDERINEYQRDYDNRMLLLTEGANVEVDKLQSEINAMDEAGKKEERALDKRQKMRELEELRMKRLFTKSAEEKREIDKRANQLRDEIRKADADARREADKKELQARIEKIRKEEQIRKDALAKELEEKKEAEKIKLEEQEKAIKDELERLQKSSDDKLAIEKDRVESNLKILADEKELIKGHYEELLKQENIMAEAREMVIKGNNDDIINLLNTYNPKWQDAGQSFGESIVNGLNSKKQSMHNAIADLMKIPTVKINAEYTLNGISSNLNNVAGPYSGSGRNTVTNSTKQDVSQNINVNIKADDLNQVNDVVKLFEDLRPTVRAGVV